VLFNLSWEHDGNGRAVLHCTVEEWNISVARQLDVAVAEMFDTLRDLGVKEAFTVSPNHKFCEYMGGYMIGGVTYKDINYWVFLWDLKQEQLH